uniref:Uncharacterized protein n=1 Tax=Arundo donax TaxID=35708 RepID=A0A0A8ZZT6_ARUDO
MSTLQHNYLLITLHFISYATLGTVFAFFLHVHMESESSDCTL